MADSSPRLVLAPVAAHARAGQIQHYAARQFNYAYKTAQTCAVFTSAADQLARFDELVQKKLTRPNSDLALIHI